MLRRLAIVLLTLCLPLAVHAIDALPFENPQQEQRFLDLTKELRCMVCQNESLADSGADLAADLRRQIFEQMQAGRSDEEIKDWLTARYGQFVLYDPPLAPRTWLLWFGPFAALAIGAGVVAAIVRRRSRAVVAIRAPAVPPLTDEEDW
jgi:cytochrome c-type biogenesis protein CcmH